MGILEDIVYGKRTKKQIKRDTLAENVRRGKAAEDQFVFQQRLMGREVKRTGRGSDFEVRDVNPWSGSKGRPQKVDVKSSHTAELSPLQRKKKARKVVVEPLFY